MKIIIINASPRKNGATAKILNEFATNLSNYKNAEIENVFLSDLRINFCVGCCQCYKTGVCYIDDDVDILSERIGKADAVIFGTPTYVSGVSGQLKTFIDRGHFVIEQLLKNKYTVGVVTYENADGGSALKTLKKLCVFSGARRFISLSVKLPFNSNPLENPKVKTKIKSRSNKLYNFMRRKKSPDPITALTHFFVFNFGIKPFVLKKGEQYAGVKKHWEAQGINKNTERKSDDIRNEWS